MPLLPGELLNKRYRITSLLSRGRYGVVYRAWDQTDRLDVAIKEYLDPSIDIQKRFRAEARRLSELRHPQLPEVLDHFALEGVGQYLVSRYIDGIDLQTLVEQYGPLPSDLIAPWLQAVCVPLEYLHKQGRLHLDIKPANIRITPQGDVFLVDGGLPGLGTRPHTPGYGAPEQQAQAEVTPVSDIYSLGATLYTLLTGITPPNALARESGLSDLRPAREANPDVEPYLSAVAGRAMTLRADARYETVADFSRALERPAGRPAPQVSPGRRTTPTQPAAASPGPVAPPPRRPVRSRRQMQNRTIIALAAALGLLLGAALLFTQFNLGGIGQTQPTASPEIPESAIIAAMTQLAPTPSPTPEPTIPPTTTPAPMLTGTGSRMIYIPGGTFLMGDDQGTSNDQKPATLIRLDPFYIDETEVTNAAYTKCVDAGVCPRPDRAGATYYQSYFGDPAFNDYPVINVSWFDAQTFCEWRDARLPTEAEWEFAAGVDVVNETKYRYPWGDSFDGRKLNYCDTNCQRDDRDTDYDDGYRDTAPVGSYPDGRSPSGVYDMQGNVMEWVADWYAFRYYREMTDTNPMGPIDGQYRVIRGGAWTSPLGDLGVSVRSNFEPTVSQANLGFRCAMLAR